MPNSWSTWTPPTAATTGRFTSSVSWVSQSLHVLVRALGGGVTEPFLSLDDKNLPSVPPLLLRVPADYPEQSPYWADDGDQYGEWWRTDAVAFPRQ